MLRRHLMLAAPALLAAATARAEQRFPSHHRMLPC